MMPLQIFDPEEFHELPYYISLVEVVVRNIVSEVYGGSHLVELRVLQVLFNVPNFLLNALSVLIQTVVKVLVIVELGNFPFTPLNRCKDLSLGPLHILSG